MAKVFMASVIMLNVFMANVLWKIKLSPKMSCKVVVNNDYLNVLHYHNQTNWIHHVYVYVKQL